jgi:type IV pili sensor histidine kinase/response regulator
MSRRIGLLVVGLCATLGAAAAPDEPGAQVGRYSTLEPIAPHHQTHLLETVVQVRFPERRVQTTGEAIRHLLARSGYALAAPEASDPALAALLALPLPAVQRELGPVTVQAGLETLAGPAYCLVIDHVHRLVSFELVPRYRALPDTARPAPTTAPTAAPAPRALKS